MTLQNAANKRRRIPIVATLIVLIAAAIMVKLGLWQLDRLHQKEAMLARYAAAQTMSSVVTWPQDKAQTEAALYHRSSLSCARVTAISAIAGRSDKGASGWAHIARCQLAGGGEAEVVLGWSRNPDAATWSGGAVSGMIAPSGRVGARLIASPPLAGLGASAAPDPSDIPNNHFAYAVQWFLFAATALVIYALALRKRLAAGEERG
jgi:surfeit locus 1 family protein